MRFPIEISTVNLFAQPVSPQMWLAGFKYVVHSNNVQRFEAEADVMQCLAQQQSDPAARDPSLGGVQKSEGSSDA
jgi:hypothetical protein